MLNQNNIDKIEASFEKLRVTDPDRFEAECRAVCDFARQHGWIVLAGDGKGDRQSPFENDNHNEE